MNGNRPANLIGAIRGPVMLITIGTLFALDQFTGFGFSRTWPAILIILGLLSLGERLVPGNRRDDGPGSLTVGGGE